MPQDSLLYSEVQINDVTGIIIDEAIKLHRELGPGLLESVYERLLAYCLNKRGLEVRTQIPIPFSYEQIKFDVGFRADIIVEGLVIVEIKSIEAILPVHLKQVLTYLKLTGKTVGILLNFNESELKKGIKRIVNNFEDPRSLRLSEQ
jgi:GxxExxY protein